MLAAPRTPPAVSDSDRESPAALRRRVRELEARGQMLENGIRRALLAHASGSEPCVCPICQGLRALLLGAEEGEPRAVTGRGGTPRRSTR